MFLSLLAKLNFTEEKEVDDSMILGEINQKRDSKLIGNCCIELKLHFLSIIIFEKRKKWERIELFLKGK